MANFDLNAISFRFTEKLILIFILNFSILYGPFIVRWYIMLIAYVYNEVRIRQRYILYIIHLTRDTSKMDGYKFRHPNDKTKIDRKTRRHEVVSIFLVTNWMRMLMRYVEFKRNVGWNMEVAMKNTNKKILFNSLKTEHISHVCHTIIQMYTCAYLCFGLWAKWMK